jgi:hypothetical protein
VVFIACSLLDVVLPHRAACAAARASERPDSAGRKRRLRFAAYDRGVLDYLDFESSEDALGHGSFDAMASATPAQLAGLQAEIVRVLQWAHASFGAPGPLDEGAEWDCELQGVREVPTTLDVRFDPRAGALDLRPGATGAARVTLSLTLTGTPAFCDALRAAFGIAA